MQDPKPIFLEYALREKSSEERKWPLSGIFSLVSMLLQIPWGFFWGMVAWDNADKSGGGALASFCMLVAVLPSVLALILSCYSLWTAGIQPRNTCGVLGITFLAAEVLWVFHDPIWTIISRFPAAILLTVVVLSISLWWAKRSLRRNAPSDATDHAPRDLLNLLFTIFAAIPLPVILLVLMNDDTEIRVWSWSEPPKQVAGNVIIPRFSDPRFRTVITPMAAGVECVRTGVEVQGTGAPYFQDECYIGVPKDLVISVLAVLPFVWLLARLLAWLLRLSMARG